MKRWISRIAATIGLCAVLAGSGVTAEAQFRHPQEVHRDIRSVARDVVLLRRLEERHRWQVWRHEYREARITAARIRALRYRLRQDRRELRHSRP